MSDDEIASRVYGTKPRRTMAMERADIIAFHTQAAANLRETTCTPGGELIAQLHDHIAAFIKRGGHVTQNKGTHNGRV